MCGIFGCVKKSQPLSRAKSNLGNLIIKALNLLKNRGYDSCGIFLTDGVCSYVAKFGVDGEIIKTLPDSNTNDIFVLLENSISKIEDPSKYTIGIGHTRWATHGGKTDYNSHPHTSNNGKITIVHNGIISNFDELKEKYLLNYNFKSGTDTEVIANTIQYLQELKPDVTFDKILSLATDILEGTWACIIHNQDEPEKLYFMKNENPLLIGVNESMMILTSEPSGFMNLVDNYLLLREKTYGYVDGNTYKIFGEYKELPLLKNSDNDIILDNYAHWMRKEIQDQTKLNVLIDPVTKKLRYNQTDILFDMKFIAGCKYLYIIACGSSYYAGLIASNYFRYTKAFEFVNVYDGGEFSRVHLEAIENPERDLLIILISQSGETRDLNIATTICREYSSNRINILEPNKLIADSDPLNVLMDSNYKTLSKVKPVPNEIKIIGIINVVGSLISRRTIDNIYTNCGRENAVASTKSCTSQILACLLLSIYKAELNEKLDAKIKNKFLTDLNRLEIDIATTLGFEQQIQTIALTLLTTNIKSMFILGKDELHGSALEGALKIKEIAYIHAEGFHISALKHGPYAMIESNTPIILLYKQRDHFVKSIVEEIKTRGAFIIEISPDALSSPNSIILPNNKTFTGLIAVIVLQLLSYHLSIAKGINPDRPRNLAKVVTVD
jgi:glucosamine--fructose-6-phosphate aminotransferase (isomerizing)